MGDGRRARNYHYSARSPLSGFSNRENLIGLNVFQQLLSSARPPNLNVGRNGASQSEMEARIVGGIKARLSYKFLRLALAATVTRNSRANGASIRLRANQLQLEPVIVSAKIVAQQ